MDYTNLKKIFELGRPIIEDSKNSYIHFGYKNNKINYRLITSGEIYVRGKTLDIPQYVYQFMSFHQEAIMIANIIKNKVINIVFRSTDRNKEFLKVGTTKSTFYGIGELSKDFIYGTPIILVEGHLDRDMMATIYPNTLGVMTNHLSRSQVQLLNGLTNKFILMLDNDEPGQLGTKHAKYVLKGNKVMVLKHDVSLKDAGDLVKLEITNKQKYNDIIDNYKAQISLF